MKSDFNNRFLKDPIVDVFILGSPTSGESILFLIRDKEDIIYSCCIDSFRLKDDEGCNIAAVIPVLRSFGIDSLDDLFWTHPHDDHCLGLDEIISKFLPKRIWIPAGLFSNAKPGKGSLASKKLINHLSGIINRLSRKNHVMVVDSVKTGMSLDFGTAHIIGQTMDELPFHVEMFAPYGPLILRYSNAGIWSANDFSIVMDMKLGAYNFLFTGDIENGTIDHLIKDYFPIPCPDLLKIPHHGSDSSNKFLNFVELPDDKNPIAVTTAKSGKRPLPDASVISDYINHGYDVYRISPSHKGLAEWHGEFNLLRNNINISPSKHSGFIFCN